MDSIATHGSRLSRIAGLPFDLVRLNQPQAWMSGDDTLMFAAGPKTDWFADPYLGTTHVNAPALVGKVDGNYLLSAYVVVEFASKFDAGGLVLWRDKHNWAKLCLEYSPDREPMVVSVVTREVSDDCNSFPIEGRGIWLRIAKLGHAYAFHASADGFWWHLIRNFALSGDEFAVGFHAQSPCGENCAAKFAGIRFVRSTLQNIRDGT